MSCECRYEGGFWVGDSPRCTVHQSKMDKIYQVVWVEGRFLDETWALQDGYGYPGMTPIQGWDWSGIRDSSPSAIDSMYEVVGGR